MQYNYLLYPKLSV